MPFTGNGNAVYDVSVQKNYGEYSQESKIRKRLYIKTGIGVIGVLCVTVFTLLLIFYTPFRNFLVGKMPSVQLENNCLTEARAQRRINHKLGVYTQAAVAADDARCSTIGRNILKKNGSAADAAIAALLCVGVVNSHSAGIGGGSFIMHYSRSKNAAKTYNAREKAPSNAFTAMFKNNPPGASTGGLAVAVPGEIAGYAVLHKNHGKLPWSDLFADAIDLAHNGFSMGRALAKAVRYRKVDIMRDSNLRAVFYDSKNKRLKDFNDTIILKKLAATLRTIANDWTQFYNGSLSKDIVEDINSKGGNMTVQDLQSYKVGHEKPVVTHLREKKRLFTMPPPSSGIVLQLILAILKGFGISNNMIKDFPSRALTYHRIAEAFKFAYGKRSFLGDPKFEDIQGVVKNMTSQAFADSFRSLINDSTTHKSQYYVSDFDPVFIPDDFGTTHVSVLAPNGDAVSITSTINTYFGSKVMGTKTGIIFNNEMDDFSTPNTTNSFGLVSSKKNYIKPGKQPMSSMSPTVIVNENGDIDMVVGAAGGTKITTAVAWVIIHALWIENDLKRAVDEPRLHHQLWPTQLQHECTVSKEILDAMKRRNHKLKLISGESVIHAILRRNNKIYAYCDWRKGGLPDGW